MPDLASLDLEVRLKEMFSDDFSGDLIAIARASAKKTLNTYTFNDTNGVVDYLYKTGYSVLSRVSGSRKRLADLGELVENLDAAITKDDVKIAITKLIVDKGEWTSSSSNTFFISSLVSGSYPDDELSGDVTENVIRSREAIITFFSLSTVAKNVVQEGGEHDRKVIVNDEEFTSDTQLPVSRARSETLVEEQTNSVAADLEELKDDTERYVDDDLGDDGLRDSLLSRTPKPDSVPLPFSHPSSMASEKKSSVRYRPNIIWPSHHPSVLSLGIGAAFLPGQMSRRGVVCTRTSPSPLPYDRVAAPEQLEMQRDERDEKDNVDLDDKRPKLGVGFLSLFPCLIRRLATGLIEDIEDDDDKVTNRNTLGL